MRNPTSDICCPEYAEQVWGYCLRAVAAWVGIAT